MSEPLLPARFLFRFAVPCWYHSKLWTARGTTLSEKHRLLSLAELEGRPAPAEVRAAWSEAGLAFVVLVEGKRRPAWCRASRPEDSDGFQVWIDTRDVHNVHRAGRFCHRFLFLPAGGGPTLEEPLAQSLPINRAREPARPVQPGQLQVRSRLQARGYRLEAFISTEALLDFDLQEHPRLGFTYAVLDQEWGEQTFGVGSPLPYQEDPSLWATLELVR
ncbi:MAG: hypothetical protein ABSF26_01760 [Thermoguttaceae bacterium]